MDIHLHPVSGSSSEQFPDRQSDGLTEDIPECDFDGADGGVEDGSAAPAWPAIHRLPVHLDIGRVLPQQVSLVFQDRLFDGLGLAGDRAFPETDESVVGQHLDVDVVLVARVDDEGLEVGDLEFVLAGLFLCGGQRAVGSGEPGESRGGCCGGTVEQITAVELADGHGGVSWRGLEDENPRRRQLRRCRSRLQTRVETARSRSASAGGQWLRRSLRRRTRAASGGAARRSAGCS